MKYSVIRYNEIYLNSMKNIVRNEVMFLFLYKWIVYLYVLWADKLFLI